MWSRWSSWSGAWPVVRQFVAGALVAAGVAFLAGLGAGLLVAGVLLLWRRSPLPIRST